MTEPSLRINEDGENGGSHNDEDNDESDWIELNEQAGAASLNGWYLTDDPDDLTSGNSRRSPSRLTSTSSSLPQEGSQPTSKSPAHQLPGRQRRRACSRHAGRCDHCQPGRISGSVCGYLYGADPAGRQLGYFQVPTPVARTATSLSRSWSK